MKEKIERPKKFIDIDDLDYEDIKKFKGNEDVVFLAKGKVLSSLKNKDRHNAKIEFNDISVKVDAKKSVKNEVAKIFNIKE